MIETTLPTNIFDQLSSSYEDGTNFIAYNDEIHSILVYIGLITVILFLIFVIFSLIYKCIKIFDDETITTKNKKMSLQSKRYQIKSLTSKQMISSSISSPSLLTSYYKNKSLAKPSTDRTFQYKNQYSLLISNV